MKSYLLLIFMTAVSSISAAELKYRDISVDIKVGSEIMTVEAVLRSDDLLMASRDTNASNRPPIIATSADRRVRAIIKGDNYDVAGILCNSLGYRGTEDGLIYMSYKLDSNINSRVISFDSARGSLYLDNRSKFYLSSIRCVR